VPKQQTTNSKCVCFVKACLTCTYHSRKWRDFHL